MRHTPPRDDDALQQRWSQAQVRVRCGLAADAPACVRAFLHCGAELAQRDGLPAFKVPLRVLRTLLQTAQDEALPRSWRNACLDHAHAPLLQLAASIGLHDPVAMEALEAAVQRARRRLLSTRAASGPGLSPG